MRPLPVRDGDGPTGRDSNRTPGSAPRGAPSAATRPSRQGLRVVETSSVGNAVLLNVDGLSVKHSGPREQAGNAAPTDQTPDQHRVAALLRLAQRGDGEAFGRIYDRYVDHVYRYLYYRLGSHRLAEALTSETFVRALHDINSFSRQSRDIRAWFISIARTLANDDVNSSRFRLEVPVGGMLDGDRSQDALEHMSIGRPPAPAILEAIRQLKPEHQECLVLRFLQGLSVPEAAEVMNRSDGAIRDLQLRAVRALARLLARGSDSPPEDGAVSGGFFLRLPDAAAPGTVVPAARHRDANR